MNKFLLGIGISIAITLIVFVAIAYDALVLLIFGIVVVGLLIIGLSAIGVNLFSRYTDAVLKRKALEYDHDERVIKLGYLPIGKNYEPTKPLALTPPAPARSQTAKSIQFDSADLRSSVTNLLLFSMNLLGEDSNRIASNPECASANIQGYNSPKWDKMINEYLKPKYGIVTVPGPVANGGGAYVPAEIGTVGQLYHMVLTNSPVEALPADER